jgi:uncharacterized glyoxalase superfamily protein PhnB
MPQGSTVVPTLLYRNAPAMIDWLCDVIGFAKKAVHANDDGTVGHAELTLGPGMLMIGSVQPPNDALPFTKLVRPPDELDNIETQSPSLYVADPDAVYAKVKARGGEIVLDIEDKHYGGRGFGFRDPEGHLWFVGSYDPWAASTDA